MLKSCGKISLTALLVVTLGALPATGAFVTVHDWSVSGPGGRYGILACGETIGREEMPPPVHCVIICLGPKGEPEVSVEMVEIAALVTGSGLFALAFLMFRKPSHEQRTA